MKIFYLLLVLIVLYFGLESIVFLYKIKRLPKLPDPEKTELVLGQGPTLRYIVAGDSAGVGRGASSLESTFAYKIAEFFAKTNTVNYKNIAVAGYKTSDVLENQVSQIIAYNPEVVVVSMSGNDATHLVSTKKVLENYKKIISLLEAQTKAKIYITNVPNFNGAKTLPALYIQFIQHRAIIQNQQIQKFEDNRVKIVDIHNFGWSEEPYKDRSKTYSADNFHPNDLGYQNWTNAFLNKIMD